jgi:hypothetical protein
MKTFVFALGLFCPVLLGAQSATGGARPVQNTAASRAASDSAARIRAQLLEEEQQLQRRLERLRGEYLARADWADIGDRCAPGALRVFPRDTTPEGRDSVQALVEDMERIVVGRGAGSPLTTPDARRLLRTIVGWEAGIDRPRWDVATRDTPRDAIATGLTGDVPDPTGPGCLPSAARADTVTFVIPGFTDMEFPKAPTPRVKAWFGPNGQRQVRDDFFNAVGSRDPEADLLYVLVAPMVIWKDYAVVGVRRAQERGGIQVDGSNRGGSAYLMRRVGTEWRLLSIVRSWGG